MSGRRKRHAFHGASAPARTPALVGRGLGLEEKLANAVLYRNLEVALRGAQGLNEWQRISVLALLDVLNELDRADRATEDQIVLAIAFIRHLSGSGHAEVPESR